MGVRVVGMGVKMEAKGVMGSVCTVLELSCAGDSPALE